MNSVENGWRRRQFEVECKAIWIHSYHIHKYIYIYNRYHFIPPIIWMNTVTVYVFSFICRYTEFSVQFTWQMNINICVCVPLSSSLLSPSKKRLYTRKCIYPRDEEICHRNSFSACACVYVCGMCFFYIFCSHSAGSVNIIITIMWVV